MRAAAKLVLAVTSGFTTFFLLRVVIFFLFRRVENIRITVKIRRLKLNSLNKKKGEEDFPDSRENTFCFPVCSEFVACVCGFVEGEGEKEGDLLCLTN